jgi:hypothetical protein
VATVVPPDGPPPGGPGQPASPAPARPGGGTRLRPADLRVPALLAGGFCAVVVVGAALLGLLPAFLEERRGATAAAGGTATALVALSSVLGSLAAGWLLGRGVGLRAPAAAGLLMPPASLPLAAGGSFGGVVGAAALMAANGVQVAGVFAAVPRVAAVPDHLAVVNGLVAQLGSTGSLLGPPLLAWAVGAAGWGVLPPFVAVFTVLGLVLLLLAESRAAAG